MATHSKLFTAAGAAAALLWTVPCVIKRLRQQKGDAEKETGTQDAEFGGVVGSAATMVALPGLIWMLYYGCNKDFVMRGIDVLSLADMPLPSPGDLISLRACAIVFGWFGFQVLLERFLPGAEVEGVDLAPAGGKGKLRYRMSGHLQFWVSIATAALFRGQLAVLYDEFPAMAGAAIALSSALSVYLYWKSFAPGTLLARGGNTGNPVYDFFIGRELNPRIGSFDLKEFCELRPGLIGWAVLNLGMAAKQYQVTGAVSGSMVLVNLLQGLYVWDALYNEQAILTTMDITTDGFGYMLAFGDLAWVPFVYGLQARYLVDHDPALSPLALAAVAAIGAGGYAIFRGSNGQKDAFRRNPTDPSVSHLKTLAVTNQLTGKETKLIISGWWGMARKINYTGDWAMAWSWSLCTGCPFPAYRGSGTGSMLTYFYPIYFAVLLVHRAFRDDHFCSQKYGADWQKYKAKVPALFFPGLL
eukprot:TRINITY_DN19002_c0_g1_i1.p1 TRINITY_DN19002_c0_g1~~TRINITY_DN19002_c0_g1_i1.p1  ORF type:complete len:471 (+),score=143.81 TRINITY_DN19002_c0_g1_i1:98-1510(+)